MSSWGIFPENKGFSIHPTYLFIESFQAAGFSICTASIHIHPARLLPDKLLHTIAEVPLARV
jgi:hypothetical protein